MEHPSLDILQQNRQTLHLMTPRIIFHILIQSQEAAATGPPQSRTLFQAFHLHLSAHPTHSQAPPHLVILVPKPTRTVL